ncbi:MAG: serine hydrolase domain-containing protein [Fimbriimonadaceae bacterium]
MPTTTVADKADDFVQDAMKKSGTPGMSVAVIQNGKVIKLKGYGFANLEHKVKVTPETIFQSGSVGKQFTAALVMKLVEDGKIKLDESIRTYLPDASPSWEKVTVRHLLTHTSGLSDPYEKLDMRKDYSEEELLKIDGEIPVIFQPGEKWSYSNTGYHVLGFLCSKVGGKFYGDQLVERIFKPAGMKTARIITESDIVMNRSAGYEIVDGKPFNQTWVAPMLNTTGDGSIYLSLQDMVNWNAALDRDDVLSNSIKQQMWTSAVLPSGTVTDYGFGWSLEPVNGHKHIGHNGAWQGFRTSIRRFPDDKLAVIVLANSDAADPHKLAQQVAGCYIPELARQSLKAIPDTAPEVTKLLLSLLDGDASNAQKLMTTEMWGAVTKEGFEGFVKELQAFGERNMVVPVRISRGGKNVSYRVRYGKESRLITISLDDKGLIQGMGNQDDD